MKMKELIDREDALNVLCDACGNVACPAGRIPRCSFYEKMQAIPAALTIPDLSGLPVYPLDPDWHKAHREMGFLSPLADVYEALGFYDETEDGPPRASAPTEEAGK